MTLKVSKYFKQINNQNMLFCLRSEQSFDII